jgi:hypothetical protein
MEALMNHLHNAEVSLELCRATLAQTGEAGASENLCGLELHNVEAARLALGILRGTRVTGKAAELAKSFTLSALEAAIQSSEPYGDA